MADRAEADPSSPPSRNAAGELARVRRLPLTWGRRAAALLIFVAVLEYLVLPQVAGTRAALHTLSTVRPAWVVLGVALEGLSMFSYSLLTRSVLPDERPSFSWLLRTDMTALGVSHIVPGGTATAAALRYRLLRQGGTPREDAIIGATVQGIGSFVVLAALLLVGLVASMPFDGFDVGLLVAAGLDAAAIAVIAAAVFALARGSDQTYAAIAGIVRRLPQRFQARAHRGFHQATGQIYQLLANKKSQRRSAAWSAVNWSLDAASLWVFLAAFGFHANPFELMVGYGIANVAAVLPISPGGLGVIEGILIPTLVGFGAPSAAAVLGVVSWRLFSFWAPIPLSGLCYLSMRTENWRDRRDLGRVWNEFGTVLAERHVTAPTLDEEPAEDRPD